MSENYKKQSRKYIVYFSPLVYNGYSRIINKSKGEPFYGNAHYYDNPLHGVRCR